MNTRIRLLKLAARRPLLTIALALALMALGVVLIGAATLAGRGAAPAGAADVAAGNPRAILGRVWFDALPEKRTDTVQIWIWFGGGIAFYESGSAYRATMELVEFERQGDKLDMTFLHDKKKAVTKFTIARCDDKPPFDLCLTLDDSPRGPRKWYGFGDEEDLATKLPWGRQMLRAAEARAAAR